MSTAIGLNHYLVLGALLFVCGALCMATKRNAIGVLMGVELVLNGAPRLPLRLWRLMKCPVLSWAVRSRETRSQSWTGRPRALPMRADPPRDHDRHPHSADHAEEREYLADRSPRRAANRGEKDENHQRPIQPGETVDQFQLR